MWAKLLEAGFSAGDIMRILAAVAAGDATGLDTNPSFTGLDDATTRVAGNRSSGTRTMTTVDGAE